VSEESCFVNSPRSSVWIGQNIGVIRSKPDERKLFNVPALVGKGTKCGLVTVHGEPEDDGGGLRGESVEIAAETINESPIAFRGSIVASVFVRRALVEFVRVDAATDGTALLVG
jgi:hypothetical protein